MTWIPKSQDLPCITSLSGQQLAPSSVSHYILAPVQTRQITYGNKFTDHPSAEPCAYSKQPRQAALLCPDSPRDRRAGWTRGAGHGDPPSCAARCGWHGWTPAGSAPGAAAVAAASATRSTRPAACWKSSAAATPHPALTAQRQNTKCCVPLSHTISSYGLSFLWVSFPTATYTHPALCLYRLCKN